MIPPARTLPVAEMTRLLGEIALAGRAVQQAQNCMLRSHDTNHLHQLGRGAPAIPHATGGTRPQEDAAVLRLHTLQTHRGATEAIPMIAMATEVGDMQVADATTTPSLVLADHEDTP
jgi:hypothetical protein